MKRYLDDPDGDTGHSRIETRSFLMNKKLTSEKLAFIRRLALNLARMAEEKKTKSIRGRLKKAGWNHNYALKLIGLAGPLPKNGVCQSDCPGKNQVSHFGFWLIQYLQSLYF